jgi:hypothetical protein
LKIIKHDDDNDVDDGSDDISDYIGWPTLMMHGTSDPIYGTSQGILVNKSITHALSIGMTLAEYNVKNPLISVSYVGANHSFDGVSNS